MPQDGAGSDTRRMVRTNCPECRGNLAVMRVFGGKAQSEYWTLRCTRCGAHACERRRVTADSC
jgi:hypothetical protein